MSEVEAVEAKEMPAKEMRICASCEFAGPGEGPISLKVPTGGGKVIGGPKQEYRSLSMCICGNKDSARFGVFQIVQSGCDNFELRKYE